MPLFCSVVTMLHATQVTDLEHACKHLCVLHRVAYLTPVIIATDPQIFNAVLKVELQLGKSHVRK